MCVEAWKLHHSNNQMCKGTWIPKAWQTAAVCVRQGPSNISMVSKQMKGAFWEVIRREGNVTFQGMERDLDGVKKGQCLHLLLPEHLGHPCSTSWWAMTAQGQICSKERALCPPKKGLLQARVHQHATASHGQPSEKTKLAPSSFGKRCWPGTSESPPSG